MNISDILYIAVIAQGLLLALLVVLIRGKENAAPLFLSAYILLSTLGLLGHVGGTHDVVLYAPLYALFLLVVLKSPALYLYLRALTEPGFRCGRRELLHLLLLLPGAIFSLGFLNGPSLDGRIEVLADAQAPAINTFGLFMRFVVIAYALASLRLLLKHQQFLESHFSVIEKISLNWLKWLLLLVLGFECIRLGLYALALMQGSQPSVIIVLLINAAIIYTVSLGGLRQPLIFTDSITRVIQRTAQEPSAGEEPSAYGEPSAGREPSADKEPSANKKPLTQSQSIVDHAPPAAQKTIEEKAPQSLIQDGPAWAQLETLMKVEAPYRNNELSLPDLAQLASLRARELSGLINRQFGGSFYEYINFYRVQAAQQALADPAQQSRKLLDIAMDAGFNSESTFYTHFKKHCGTTPRKFRQAQQR